MSEENDAVLELREWDVRGAEADAQVGVFGFRRCGKTIAAQSIVRKIGCKNVCVLSPDPGGMHAAAFGAARGVPTLAVPLYAQADGVIVDDMHYDRAVMRLLAPCERGKPRVLTARHARQFYARTRDNFDYALLGCDYSGGSSDDNRGAFCTPEMSKTRWHHLVAAASRDPTKRYRFLVCCRTMKQPVYSWYEAHGAERREVRVRRVFGPRRSGAFLQPDLVSRVASLLPLRDAVSLYSVQTALYDHGARHIARRPPYEHRVAYPGNIVVVTMRAPPTYTTLPPPTVADGSPAGAPVPLPPLPL